MFTDCIYLGKMEEEVRYLLKIVYNNLEVRGKPLEANLEVSS